MDQNKAKYRSSGSGESYDLCILSETLSAEKEVILSDQTHLTLAVSALSAVLSEFSCVSSPKQVWHSFSGWMVKINIFLLNINFYSSKFNQSNEFICFNLALTFQILNQSAQTQKSGLMQMNQQMSKTFNIEDMETYFKNYVPCHFHKKQPITNFCTDMACNKYLCPQCIEEHSRVHSTHRVESIKTSISRTRARIEETILFLQNETRKNDFLSPQNHEQFTKKLIGQMHEVKRGLIQQIELYFKEKQAEVRRQTSKYTQTQKNLEYLKKQLEQATKELKALKKGLFEPSKTVTIIEKTNKIDYPAMMDHFRKKIKKIEKELKINIKLEMDPKRRQEFRMSLNDLIGIRGKQNQQQKRKEQFHDSLVGSPTHGRQGENYFASTKKQYIVNPQPLSVDREMSKNSFLIDYPNYFKSGEPFLHFFELSKRNLHVIKITDLQANNSSKWDVIPLKIDFDIPSFHRTIATQDGVIYLIGGTDQLTKRKVSKIYEYSPGTKNLKPVADLKYPRSSHSIACFRGLVYIVGGMGDDDVLRELEIFNPSINTTQSMKSCKYATVNSCLSVIGNDSLLKLGGIFANGENNDHIEIYNITSNQWIEIDPVIEGVKGDFALLSCSGWSPLTGNQVFIFGGYNEQADNQSSNSSFIIEYDQEQKQYLIRHINNKKLPIEEGFWSSQSIVFRNTIYALQNVNDGDGDDCAEDKRNVLMFDGKYWKICYGE